MNKLLVMSLAGMSLFGLASCSNEDIPTPVGDGDGNVTLQLQLPEDLSRTFSDGTKAKQLHYAVYNSTDNTTPIIEEVIPDAFENSLTTTIKLQLVNTKSYNIIFWADTPTAEGETPCYTFDAATQSITANYEAIEAKGVNYEEADAFYASTSVTVNGAFTGEVTLYRPLAQINLGTSDWNTAAVSSANLSLATDLKVNACSSLNLRTGVASNPVEVTFEKGDLVSDDETFPVNDRDDIKYLSMNYVLVGKDHSMEDAVFTIYNNYYTSASGTKYYTKIATIDVPNLPLQGNYRTNVFGNLLTDEVELKVTIDPIYYGNFEVEIPRWDGKSVALAPNEDGEYHVTLPGHLAYIAEKVNDGTLATAKVYLDNDIDLYNHQWTPIGVTGYAFKGTFDGQGHTIKNLSAHGKFDHVGLFGYTTGSKVSNLTVENVHIVNTNTATSAGTGAIAGTPFTGSFNNITLTGEVQVTGFRYVGGMFGHNFYSSSSGNFTVAIPQQDLQYSYVKATASGTLPCHCGGIIGYMGEGTKTLSNLTSNLPVITVAPGAGGLVGTLQEGVTIANSSCSAPVTITLPAGYAAANYKKYTYAIGGIAGCFLATSHVTDCTVTGTITCYTGTTLATLRKANEFIGIKYAGTLSGFQDTYTGVTINGEDVTGVWLDPLTGNE